MPSLLGVPAPAKINLFLHVVGRRPDGYHLLQTAFRFIDLCDTLHFQSRGDGRIIRATDLPGVPVDSDLTVRAARVLQQATGTWQGVEIRLEKRIPAGGGLGGGSSDAATVLVALNRLWNTRLTRAQLLQLALPLGADVPVFVFGRNAFAEGVGEQLTAIELPPRWYVIIQPDANVPTADIFRAPELTRDSSPVKIADFSEGSNFFAGRNDLEAVAFARFAEVGRVARLASEAVGRAADKIPAEPLQVRMSGSGACLFIECASKSQADWAVEEIAVKMRDQPGGSPQPRINRVCAGLDAHPLLDWVAA